MKNVDALKELEDKTGTSNIFRLLINTLKSIISVVEIPQNIQKLNNETRKTIQGLKKAATSFLVGPQNSLRKINTAKDLLNNSKTETDRLKSELGLVASDFSSVIEVNPLKTNSFMLLILLIILLDFLVGAVKVLGSNQSPLISSLLMFSAILAAYFYYLAGPIIAVGIRMRAEVKHANEAMKGFTGFAVKQAYVDDPELALPLWLRPSEKKLSHNEGSVLYVNGKWILKRNQTMAMAIAWILIGTLCSFLRLLPVMAEPDLYGGNAIYWQIGILVVALAVNSVILLLEIWRRRDSGLPNSIQKMVNKALQDKKVAQKILGDGSEEKQICLKIGTLKTNTQEALTKVKVNYKESFGKIIAQKDAFDSLMETYRKTYTDNEVSIKTFYDGLQPIGFEVEQYSSQIPRPEIVSSTYSFPSPSPDYSQDEIEEAEFTFTLEKENETENQNETKK